MAKNSAVQLAADSPPSSGPMRRQHAALPRENTILGLFVAGADPRCTTDDSRSTLLPLHVQANNFPFRPLFHSVQFRILSRPLRSLLFLAFLRFSLSPLRACTHFDSVYPALRNLTSNRECGQVSLTIVRSWRGSMLM
jgi:hypothetical protein